MGDEDEVALAIRKDYHTRFRRKLVGTIVVLSIVGIGLAGVIGVIAAASMGTLNFGNPWMLFAMIGGVFMILIGFSLFQMINWRCPRCQTQFRALRNPRFCYNCGVRLRE